MDSFTILRILLDTYHYVITELQSRFSRVAYHILKLFLENILLFFENWKKKRKFFWTFQDFQIETYERDF